jgi:hypothetical protein
LSAGSIDIDSSREGVLSEAIFGVKEPLFSISIDSIVGLPTWSVNGKYCANDLPIALRQHLAKSGSKSSKKSAESLTAAQRSARAKKVAATRWKKKSGAGTGK